MISEIRAERIARNINAMDLNYDRIDQFSKWKFWSDLNVKLSTILNTLSEADKNAVAALCKPKQAQYFNLI